MPARCGVQKKPRIFCARGRGVCLQRGKFRSSRCICQALEWIFCGSMLKNMFLRGGVRTDVRLPKNIRADAEGGTGYNTIINVLMYAYTRARVSDILWRFCCHSALTGCFVLIIRQLQSVYMFALCLHGIVTWGLGTCRLVA